MRNDRLGLLSPCIWEHFPTLVDGSWRRGGKSLPQKKGLELRCHKSNRKPENGREKRPIMATVHSTNMILLPRNLWRRVSLGQWRPPWDEALGSNRFWLQVREKPVLTELGCNTLWKMLTINIDSESQAGQNRAINLQLSSELMLSILARTTSSVKSRVWIASSKTNV